MKYTTVTDLKFSNESNTTIDCTVDFETIGNIPFSASADDNTQHGRDIYDRAVKGDFGTIAPYVHKTEPPKSLEQIKNDITYDVQKRLDSFAQTRNYDSILSACTYATSSVSQFAQEGQYCVNMRDATWAKLYDIMQEVEAGTRPMPTGYVDIEAELPVLDWANV